MERNVAGRLRLVEEGRLSTPTAAAVMDGNTVIVEVLPTPMRYYVVPALTGILTLSVSSSLAESVGGGGFLWEFLGMGVGVLAGMAVAIHLQRRKQEGIIDRIRRGERDLANEIVVKKGKVNRIELEGNGKKTLKIVTSGHDFELVGDSDEVERVYEALT